MRRLWGRVRVLRSGFHAHEYRAPAAPTCLSGRDRPFAARGLENPARSRHPAYLLGGLFAFIGTLLIWGLQVAGLAPMTLPVVGASCWSDRCPRRVFGLSQAARGGSRPRLRDLLQGFRSASREVWVMALLCVFLFLIWITDAGTLYSFMIGERSHGLLAILPLTERTLHYVLGSGLMGGGSPPSSSSSRCMGCRC